MSRLFLLLCLLAALMSTADGSELTPVGAAVTDITPDFPVRLSGYASRRTESDGVLARIHARALAIGGKLGDHEARQPLCVLVTVDNCGVGADIVEAVFEELAVGLDLDRSCFAVSSTHTHTAPWLMNCAPLTLSGVTEDQRVRLRKYEKQLRQQLVDVVRAAVQRRQPAQLSLGFGHADFARNRRALKDGRYAANGIEENGPVDHRLPVLAAHTADNSLIALLTNYACHATTNAGADNKIGGDWPGFAADNMEADHPGAVALVAVGCGGDINPLRSADQDHSREHARTFADSVKRVLNNSPNKGETKLTPLSTQMRCQLSWIHLPYGPLPSQEEWEARRDLPGVDGELARHMLRQIERGDDLPTGIENYPVQTWTFGDDLAMVFLGGEAVLDYSLRLGEMLDPDRLWVNAYCNDVPCYIPSKRVLREGGYEADTSQKYYGRPGRLSPEIEDRICWAVQKQVPHQFYSDALLTEFPGPKSPEEALNTMSLHADLKVELVAVEPLTQDPVAFDWDHTGRLWVVEMGNYPEGSSGGRVRILQDDNGDGQYDSATTFLDGLPYPSGICVWRDGAIITAAPDVIYASDKNGDGIADQQTVLCTGFSEGNQQHRVNGLRWGLDGWLYLANGDSGGSLRITGRTTDNGATVLKNDAEPVSIRFRDLRLRPDEGQVMAISGQTQFCRERDDFGNWFGNNNSNPIWHYVIETHYIQRNPFAKIGRPVAQVSFEPGAAPVYPTSKTVARFNDFHTANRFTSACGTTICRDAAIGDRFYGNALTCEPVHNLVSRLTIKSDGALFHGTRAIEEQQSEFLSSSDNWFRPTMVRTGPDGALYVSDMYRQVIEHPQWIPENAQRKLNLQAGSSMGRIYRISPRTEELPSEQRDWIPTPWQQIPLTALVQRLSSGSAWWRDTAQRLLQHRLSEWDEDLSVHLPVDHDSPAVRVQAWCTAAMLDALSGADLMTALVDQDARVRRRVIPLLEKERLTADRLRIAIERLVTDEDPGVRLQLACTLGSLKHPVVATALGQLLTRTYEDEWLRKAVLTSLNADNVTSVFQAVTQSSDAPGELISELLEQSQRFGRTAEIREPVIDVLTAATTADASIEELSTAIDVAAFVRGDAELSKDVNVQSALTLAARQAETLIQGDDKDSVLLAGALRLLKECGSLSDSSYESIADLVQSTQPVEVQEAALSVLLSADPPAILQRWGGLSPARRTQALETLVATGASATVLLTAIESGQLSAADLGAIYRDRLLNHPDQNVQLHTRNLLEDDTKTERGAIARDWTVRLKTLQGTSQRGADVFRKRCSTCHRLQDVGNQVGANLSSLRDRSTQALVTAILNPNQAVETRFQSYTAVLTDGRTISGMLRSETDTSVTLIGTDGKPQEVLRSDLQELLASSRSFMPDGLEKDLTEQDLADVIAFVQSAGTPWKQFAGNQPQVVKTNNGQMELSSANAELYGPTIAFDGGTQAITGWTSVEDRLVWQLQVQGWGFWDVEFEYASADTTAGGELRVATRGRMMTSSVPGTGGDDHYRLWTAGAIELSPGNIMLTVSPEGELSSSLMQLKAIRLTRKN